MKKFIRVIIGLYIFIFLLSKIFCVTYISNCTTINLPGTYILTQNIINSANSTCIEILSNNVTLNCNDFVLDGINNPLSIGILSINTNNISVLNCNISNWNFGIYFLNVTNSHIFNSTFFSNFYGIYLNKSSLIILNNSKLMGNNIGLFLNNSSYNSIYNNYFNNSINITISGITYPNTWNTTKTPGINIVGGNYLGGNYWGSPNGKGFSDTCTDINQDTICDNSFTLEANNTDYYPLYREKIPPFVKITPQNNTYLYFPAKLKLVYSDNVALEYCSYILYDSAGRSKQEVLPCTGSKTYSTEIYLNPSINEVCYAEKCFLRVIAKDFAGNIYDKVFVFTPVVKELNVELGVISNIIKINIQRTFEGYGIIRNAGTLTITNLSINYKWFCGENLAKVEFSNLPSYIKPGQIWYFDVKIIPYKLGRCRLIIEASGNTTQGKINTIEDYIIEIYYVSKFSGAMLIKENINFLIILFIPLTILIL